MFLCLYIILNICLPVCVYTDIEPSRIKYYKEPNQSATVQDSASSDDDEDEEYEKGGNELNNDGDDGERESEAGSASDSYQHG